MDDRDYCYEAVLLSLPRHCDDDDMADRVEFDFEPGARALSVTALSPDLLEEMTDLPGDMWNYVFNRHHQADPTFKEFRDFVYRLTDLYGLQAGWFGPGTILIGGDDVALAEIAKDIGQRYAVEELSYVFFRELMRIIDAPQDPSEMSVPQPNTPVH